MTAPRKPHWFKALDLLAFGLPTAASMVGTYLIFTADHLETVSGGEAPTGIFGAQGLMVLVTLAFLGIYLGRIWIRRSFLKQFNYVKGPNFALMVNPGKYKIARDEATLVQLTQLALDTWSRVFDPKKVADFADDALFWVWFEPHPIKQVRGQKTKMAGFTILGSRHMKVSYRDPNVDLDTTAFRHELGHVIQGHITGVWNEAEHHKRAKEYSLP